MDNGTEIECAPCLEQHSETASTVLNGLRNEALDTPIQNVQNKQENGKKPQKTIDRNGYGSIYDLNRLCVWKVPWIMVLVSTIQVVVFLVACNDSVALLVFKPHRKYELWRFLTYNTIHYSTTHLLLNVALQILIGCPLETEQGHCRVLIVYLLGIVFGATGAMFFKSAESIIGSSAGIYSLLLSHISQCILNWTVISYRCFRIFSISMLLFGDFLFSILKLVFWNNVIPKISIAAHLCGGISGLLAGLVVFKKLKSNSRTNILRDFA